jgi:hypothetical protein
VLVALELELDALPPLLPALLLLLLLELLPHAPTASARTPTAANVPDHALTFILSSASTTVAPAAEWHGWLWPAHGPSDRCLTFDKISTRLEPQAQGQRKH